MLSSHDLIGLENRYGAKNYAPLDVVLTRGSVIRFTPPLVITRQQVDWALERIEPALLNPDEAARTGTPRRTRRPARRDRGRHSR